MTKVTKSVPLFPCGQVQVLELDAPAGLMVMDKTFRARILIDAAMPTFRQCRDDNDTSEDVVPRCLG